MHESGIAVRVACACLGLVLGCGDAAAGATDAGDGDSAIADTGPADDATVPADGTPVLRDTSEVDAGVVCPLELAADLVLGRDDARWCFEPLSDGAALEIVHGIQGGIHVELRVALRGGATAPTIGLEVELTHDGTALARFASTLVGLQPLGDPAIPPDVDGFAASWATAAFPVVFANVDASLYTGLDAAVRGRVTIDGQILDLAPLNIHLVDPTAGP